MDERLTTTHPAGGPNPPATIPPTNQHNRPHLEEPAMMLTEIPVDPAALTHAVDQGTDLDITIDGSAANYVLAEGAADLASLIEGTAATVEKIQADYGLEDADQSDIVDALWRAGLEPCEQCGTWTIAEHLDGDHQCRACDEDH